MALRMLLFLAKHGVFLVLVTLLGLLLWTAVYFALLAWAMLTGGGIGGPLAWPAGLIAVLLVCPAFGLGVAMPACAAARFLGWRFGWPRLAGIPLSFAVACGLWSGWAFLLKGGTPEPMEWGVPLLWMPLPLGLWWWFTEGPGALWDAWRRWFAKRPSMDHA